VGEDWAVLSEREEDPELGTMERRIVSFRKVGEHYGRIDEVLHRVRLYDPHRSSLRTSSGPASGLGRCVLTATIKTIDLSSVRGPS
jgi:hypothetical protein